MRLLLGVITLGGGRFVAAALGLIAWSVLARSLGLTEFGILQIALAVFVYAELASDLGTSTAGTREVAARRRDRVAAFAGARLALAGATATLAVIGAVVLCFPPAQLQIVVWLAVALVAGSMNYMWMLRGNREANKLAVVEVLSPLAVLTVAVVAVHGPRDLPHAAAAIAAGALAGAAGSVMLAKIRRQELPRVTKDVFDIVARSWRLGVAGLAIAIYYSIDSLMLALLRTPEEVGLYGAAYRLVLPWLGLAGLVGALLMPMIVALGSRTSTELVPLLRQASRWLIALGVPVAVTITLVAETVLTLVFGNDYRAAGAALRIVIWSVVTVFANAPYGFLLLADRRDRVYMRIVVVGAATNIVTNLALIPAFGLIGAAGATLIAEAIVLGGILWVTRPYSLVLIPLLRMAAVAGVAMAVVMLLFGDSVISIPLGLLAYLTVASLIGLVPIGHLVKTVRAVKR